LHFLQAPPSFFEGEMIRASPTLYSPSAGHGTVYFVAGDAVFYAIDVNSGKQVWNFSKSNEKPQEFQSSSAALYDDGKGTVLVYYGTVEPKGRLLCLDALTGAFKWGFQTTGPIYSSPQVWFCCF
jgi:outer membrane protein assembly factor BamB